MTEFSLSHFCLFELVASLPQFPERNTIFEDYIPEYKNEGFQKEICLLFAVESNKPK